MTVYGAEEVFEIVTGEDLRNLMKEYNITKKVTNFDISVQRVRQLLASVDGINFVVFQDPDKFKGIISVIEVEV